MDQAGKMHDHHTMGHGPGATASHEAMQGGLSRRSFIKFSAIAGLGAMAGPYLFPRQDAFAEENIRARFIIGSDIHIPYYNSSEKLTRALTWFANALSPSPARICLVGDLVDSGVQGYYDTLNAVLDSSSFGRESFVFCQGNHETYGVGVAAAPALFELNLGQKPNKLMNVKGVPIITMGPNTLNDGYYVANHDFLEQSLDAITSDATYTKGSPILLLCHHSIPNTAYTSQEWNGDYGIGLGEDKDLTILMQQYPQIIHVSGHSHATIEDARSIDQSLGFTCIQDSTLGAYFENERNNPHTMYDIETGEVSSYPAYNDEASQCLVLDVMADNTVQVTRYNLYPLLTGGTPYQVYEPWVIDVPGMIAASGDAGACAYMPGRTSSTAPQLPTSKTVTIQDAGRDSLTVAFPAFSSGSSSNLDMIHDYLIVLTPVDASGTPTGNALERRIFNDYYRSAEVRHETTEEPWTVKISNLAYETSYRIEIYAETSFADNGGMGISDVLQATAFGTTGAAPTPPSAILDIDYRAGTVVDAMGHPEKLYGGGLVEDNTIVEQGVVNVLEVDGKGGYGYLLDADDYASFVNQSSTECYFKMIDVDSDQCVFSNQQGAGAGFEIENGNLGYWFNAEGGRVTPSTSISANTWVHAVATFDGDSVKLYTNGTLSSEKKAVGAMAVPSPKRYIVGADVDWNGEADVDYACKAGTRIAFARIYPRCMTAEEVADAYVAAQAASKTVTDEMTGVIVENIALNQRLTVTDTSSSPKVSLGEGDTLVASFDITLQSAEGQEVQPTNPLTITLPIATGWAGSTAQAHITHSDTVSDLRSVTVSSDDTVRIDHVERLSQFDIVVHNDESNKGGSDNENPTETGGENPTTAEGTGNEKNDVKNQKGRLVQTGDTPWPGVVAGVAGAAGVAAAVTHMLSTDKTMAEEDE